MIMNYDAFGAGNGRRSKITRTGILGCPCGLPHTTGTSRTASSTVHYMRFQ